MSFDLSFEETRVLGCLLEKERTTPEYYPLTLNSLKTACNQKSSREPVVEFDEDAVQQAVNRLKGRGWVILRSESGSRSLKFDHMFHSCLDLTKAETAVMCLLMLRGPQTAGEIRNRSGRIHLFDSVPEVEEVMSRLAAREYPLTVLLPRQPGQKERRYAHLLCGEPDLSALTSAASAPMNHISESVPVAVPQRQSQDVLEKRVEALETELRALREEFAGFRKQFE